MLRAIDASAPACWMTSARALVTPWAPLRTVNWPTCSNGEAAARTMSGMDLGDLLGDDRFLVLAQGRGAALDAGGLGLARGLDRVGFGQTAGLDRVAVGLAVEAGGVGLGLGLDLDGRGLGLGGEADFLGRGFGLADADVAPGRGERGLAIGLGVGGLADVYLELLLGPLGLQLGDERLLLDDGLAGLGLGERALLAGLLLGAVDLGLEAGLLDLGAPDRLGDLGLRRLLLGDRGLVGLGAGDAGVLLDFGLVRHGQVLDVVRRAGDRLDLEAVDDEAERLHLDGAALANLLGELVLVADHLLDGHRTGDGAQVADEDVLDLGLELDGRAVQEAAGGVGDRAVVVADLVDDDAAQVEADLLLADAGNGDLALVGHERQGPDLGQARQDHGAAAGHDLEAHALAGYPAGRVAARDARDDQGLVRLGDAPGRLEQGDAAGSGRPGRRCQRPAETRHRNSSREPHCIGRFHLNRPPPQAADHQNLGVLLDGRFGIRGPRVEPLGPCRTSISTSPRWPGVISAVTRPILPMTSYDTPLISEIRS